MAYTTVFAVIEAIVRLFDRWAFEDADCVLKDDSMQV